MTVSYLVEEVVPIAYSDPIVHDLGTFAELDPAIAAARAYVSKPDEYDGASYARITVQGW
jgi:hypothetical protein